MLNSVSERLAIRGLGHDDRAEFRGDLQVEEGLFLEVRELLNSPLVDSLRAEVESEVVSNPFGVNGASLVKSELEEGPAKTFIDSFFLELVPKEASKEGLDEEGSQRLSETLRSCKRLQLESSEQGVEAVEALVSLEVADEFLLLLGLLVIEEGVEESRLISKDEATLVDGSRVLKLELVEVPVALVEHEHVLALGMEASEDELGP